MVYRIVKYLCIILALASSLPPLVQAHGDHHEAVVDAEKHGENLLGQIKDKLMTETASNVFDWVFGDPDDAELHQHELDEHYAYLKEDVVAGGNRKTLAELASAAGIKPEFLNFKAHDYDNNDKIDGLELLALILNEKVHHSEPNSNAQQTGETTGQQVQLGSEIIDRLLKEEDLNQDGYLDFDEYTKARHRIVGAGKH